MTEGEVNQMAARTGVPPEIFRGYSNAHNGYSPQSLFSLKQWAAVPDRTYGVVRYQNGAWHALMPGPTPGADPNDPGFHHVIANAEDSGNAFPFPDPNGIPTLMDDPRWNAAWMDDAHGVPAHGWGTPATSGAIVQPGAAAGGTTTGTTTTTSTTGTPPARAPFDPLAWVKANQGMAAAIGGAVVLAVVASQRGR